MAIETFELTAKNGASEADITELERLAESHFVAPVDLTEGKWTFRVRAVSATGQAFVTQFEQQVKP